jgi:two-component sensor histidine kinase
MEKETLLKEIHHRVKNNMQLVCSMMNLQADSINNTELSDIFKVLQSRIYSMSLVHEKLYHHNQFSKINFSEYVKELVSEISKSFLNDTYAECISVDLVLQDENFTIEKAIPCGLILNELIINAFKHASLISGHGYIKIVFEKIENGCYKLAVTDNGKGLPDGFDITRTETMGMLLVRELVSQLKGSISVASGLETTFTIVFGDTQDNNSFYNPAEFGSGIKNILLVEDERIISRMLRKIIEEHGYNIVDVVSSGQDAINSAARYTPDLIIMDIMLEDEIDGVQAAIEINKNHTCPIIFLTGNSDPATLRSARNINPYQMLTKPVEKCQLIDVIESAFKCISH